MNIYTFLPDHSYKTGHYVIDDPKKPAHEEVVDLTRFLIIEEKQGGIYLNRYQADGVWIGDTWHETVEAAKYQAEFEYDYLVGDWNEIPEDVKDTLNYVLGIERKN